MHPNEGYQATVTYEGTAKYPDTPGYVPSPYAPPIRSRTAKAISEKFKRQSKKTDYKQPAKRPKGGGKERDRVSTGLSVTRLSVSPAKAATVVHALAH